MERAAMHETRRQYVYAGWDVRAVASMVDLLAVSLVMGLLLYAVERARLPDLVLGLVALCGFPTALYAYFVCAEAVEGTTLGKRLFRMSVVQEDRDQQPRAFAYDKVVARETPGCRGIPWSRALLRNVSKVIVLMPVYIVIGEIVTSATGAYRFRTGVME